MENDFARIITMLRKESGKSQKQVAGDLNISQALLSHYEKGIRECGHKFVVAVADYYDVSCDYLLGRTNEKSGAKLTINDIPEMEDTLNNERGRKVSNMLLLLNKKLLINSISVLYDVLEKTGSKGITTEVSNYLMVSVYKMFRSVYSANIKNPQGMFAVSQKLFSGYADAFQSVCSSNVSALASGSSCMDFDGLAKESAPELSPDILSKEHQFLASSLYSMIQTTESKILAMVKTK